jgi:toxin ParE1/3/4
MRVRFTNGAREDLRQISSYVARHAGPAVAADLVRRLRERVMSLSEMPDRGNVPLELEPLGVRTYRELHEAPCRIIYSVETDTVTIRLIADARGDLRSLLAYRLLR